MPANAFGSRTIIEDFLNDDHGHIKYMQCTYTRSIHIYLLFLKCIFYVDELLLQEFCWKNQIKTKHYKSKLIPRVIQDCYLVTC